MKNCSIIAALAAVLTLVACSDRALVKGTVSDFPEGEIIVKLLDINTFKVLDTLTTDKKGAFSTKVSVRSGDPEFVYLFRGERPLAGLLLKAGDKVSVSCDTLGRYSVEGSPESEKLRTVDSDFATFMTELEAAGTDAEATRRYIDFYRASVRYILENSHSLTVIPVLYRQVSPELPVFSQGTDAIHFLNMRDSLQSVYPDSRYVKALEKEAARRENQFNLSTRLLGADVQSYPDIEAPDTKGVKVKLSETPGKVVMVYFWTAADATHKMQNLDVLKPVYKDFAGKGFEIYAVSLDTDKAVWASAVRNQELPWINVCDGQGAGSAAVRNYNVSQVPSAYFLVNGELTLRPWKDEATLRKAVSEMLK